jgi:hypothetical protein
VARTLDDYIVIPALANAFDTSPPSGDHGNDRILASTAAAHSVSTTATGDPIPAVSRPSIQKRAVQHVHFTVSTEAAGAVVRD